MKPQSCLVILVAVLQMFAGSSLAQNATDRESKTSFPELAKIQRLYIDMAGNGSPLSREFASGLKDSLQRNRCLNVVEDRSQADAVLSEQPIKRPDQKKIYAWLFVDTKTDIILDDWSVVDASPVSLEIDRTLQALGCVASPPSKPSRPPSSPPSSGMPGPPQTTEPVTPLTLGATSGPATGEVSQADYSYVQSIIGQLENNRFRLPSFQWKIIPTMELNSSSDIRYNIVYIYTSMIHFLRDDRGEMAFVVAHEIGHIEDAQYQMVEKQLERRSLLPQLVQQKLETRADTIGFQYLVGAGFNPYDAAAALGRFQMFQGDTGLNGFFQRFLSDHPITESRISNLRRLLQQFCATGRISCTTAGLNN